MRMLVAGLVALSLGGLGGCTQVPHLSFAVEQRILRETTLDDLPAEEAKADDAVVRVEMTGKHAGQCSGTLIDSRHVLTAAHCVEWHDEHKEMSFHWAVAGALHVELGGDYLPWGRVGVVGVGACRGYQQDLEHDLAVLVLSKPVPAIVRPLALDWDDPPEDAEYVSEGFGSASPARSIPGFGAALGVGRHGRQGSVGRADARRLVIAMPADHGDSGGPILEAATGRVVSVTSRGLPREEVERDGIPIVAGPRLGTCRATILEMLAE